MDVLERFSIKMHALALKERTKFVSGPFTFLFKLNSIILINPAALLLSLLDLVVIQYHIASLSLLCSSWLGKIDSDSFSNVGHIRRPFCSFVV